MLKVIKKRNFFLLPLLIIGSLLTTFVYLNSNRGEYKKTLLPIWNFLKKNNEQKLKVAFITDEGSIEDHSFNESGYKGVTSLKKFSGKFGAGTSIEIEENLKELIVGKNKVENLEKELGNPKYKGLEIETKFFIPKGNDKDSFVRAYVLAIHWGATVIVLNGFLHNGGFSELEKYGDRVIVVGNEAGFENKKTNVSILNYKSEQSAFLGAVASALYFKYLGKEKVYFDSFGGMPFEGVTAYMFGFLAGILFVNEKQDIFNDIYKEIFEDDKNTSKKIKINYPETFNFSGNFDAGGGRNNSINIINDKNADLVFPAVGPQVIDLIGVIKENKSQAKILGIDVDQTKIFKKDKDLFLTNSVKKITEAIEVSILTSFIEEGEDKSEENFWNNNKKRIIGSIEGGILKNCNNKNVNEKLFEWFKNNDKKILERLAEFFENEFSGENADKTSKEWSKNKNISYFEGKIDTFLSKL